MIRIGEKKDLPLVFELIKELAEFERALDQVDNTVARMEIDGFGDTPAFEFFVCQAEEKIVGAAIFYYRYSTWKGRRLYLEDIIVTEKERGKGYGKELFDRVLDHARGIDCTGMMWQVLDWNEGAIKFYREKYQTRFDSEWLNCHIDF